MPLGQTLWVFAEKEIHRQRISPYVDKIVRLSELLEAEERNQITLMAEQETCLKMITPFFENKFDKLLMDAGTRKREVCEQKKTK